MTSVFPADRKIPRLLVVYLFLASLLSCGGTLSQPSEPRCNPGQAPEVLSLTVENTQPEILQNYPVAVSLDDTAFDFSVPSSDGSDLAVWDATTLKTIPAWLESYDPVAGKALLWLNLPTLNPREPRKLLLTAGHAMGCAATAFDGNSVFPFFSDVHDAAHWQTNHLLSVSDTIDAGPLSISARTVIQSDGMYNGFPGVAQAANGDFVLAYKKGGSHVNTPFVILRRSSDAGSTWSPEKVYFNSTTPDPSMIRTPLGALLMAFGKADPRGQEVIGYTRSNDNGLTWGPFTFFQDPPTDTLGVAPSLNVGTTIYGSGYGPAAGGNSPSLWLSSDDGFNWSKLSGLRQAGEPGRNETAIVQTAANTLFAMSRADDNVNTYGQFSTDMGVSWGSVLSYTSQVGVLQAPQMVMVGPALVLMGRETIPIPRVLPPNTIGYPRQLVAYVSYDGGQTFGYGAVLDTYTGQQIDGGYSWPMLLPNGQVFVVYYADSHNLQKPDIKSLVLSVSPPSSEPAGSIHVLSQLSPGLATRPLNLSLTRYALEFRFHSNPTPAGSQFSVLLQGQVAASPPSNLVDWEFPSTHAADPTAQSGVISDGHFLTVLDTFSYGQLYHVRTVVDEAEATQQASVLDSFGALLNVTAPQPLAHAASAHATTIQIGNNSSLRATDTLLDFVFIRPVAHVEPVLTITRVH